MRAAFVHIVGDLVQSIGVLIAAVIIKVSRTCAYCLQLVFNRLVVRGMLKDPISEKMVTAQCALHWFDISLELMKQTVSWPYALVNLYKMQVRNIGEVAFLNLSTSLCVHLCSVLNGQQLKKRNPKIVSSPVHLVV